LEKWVKKDFFVEVFVSLNEPNRARREVGAGNQELRQLTTKHLTSYLQASSFDRVPLKYARQIALYQAKVIEASYLNSVEIISVSI
jgi:hypothetical protein